MKLFIRVSVIPEIIFLIMVFSVRGHAALTTYPGCANLEAGQFRSVPLLTTIADGLQEVIRIAFDMDEEGHVDLFIAEHHGKVKHYNAEEDAISTIGEFTGMQLEGEHGLVGLAMDPGFKTNGWIYFMTDWGGSARGDFEGFWLITRITYRDGALDMGSEAVILKIQRLWEWHTGGGMEFDDYGDLWITTGDNKAFEKGPANTHDLRGKILRITPLPVAEGSEDWGRGRSYTVPAGNMGEFMAAKYPDRAAEFLDTSKVLPELFAMGQRNPYTLTIDPVRRWYTYGDCGPDGTGGQTEEWIHHPEPVNSGWPYFAGPNHVITERDGTSWGAKNPESPMNNHPENTGLTRLPPAQPGTYYIGQSCAMTGPIYRYDPGLRSSVKMPPHFNRLWFITDYNQGFIRAFRMSEDGWNIVEQEDLGRSVLSSATEGLRRPLDFKAGPDGAFYINDYAGYFSVDQNAKIVKVEYTGPACDVGGDFKVEKTGCMTIGDPSFDPDATHHNPKACDNGAFARRAGAAAPAGVSITASLVRVLDPGPHQISLTDLSGGLLASRSGEGRQVYPFSEISPKKMPGGIYIIRVRTGRGAVSKTVTRL